MKIGVITTIDGYPWAGSEELWFRSIKLAASEGHQCSAMVAPIMTTSSQVKELKDLKVKIQQRRRLYHDRIDRIVFKFSNPFVNFMNDQDITLLSLGSILDVIFVPGLDQALQQGQSKFILLCQFNSDLLLFSPSYRATIRRICELASGIVFVSEHNRSVAERQLVMPFKSAQVIYNPIKISVDKPLSFPTTDTVSFGCVARFETLWKGFDVLLTVLAQDKWLQREWQLNLYGSGPDEQYIRSLISYYSLEDRVFVRGHVADLVEVWRVNHISILASRGEGTPLAILEAMMCGRPAVTTDVGGNKEILEEGVTGFIADACTTFSFDQAMERAWAVRNDWELIGEAGHQMAKQIASKRAERQLLQYCEDCSL